MLISAYLRARRLPLVLCLLCAAAFFVTFALFHLSLKAVAYPCALCALLVLLSLLWDFFHQRARLHALGLLRAESLQEGQLPQAQSPMESAYQRLIRDLLDRSRQTETQMRTRDSDQMDYYAAWAHQIKTPIAAMNLRLQGEDSALARTLQAELGRVEQYVEMVMAYQRLDAESSDYVLERCDLDEILRPALRRFSGEFIARRLKLCYEPAKTQVLTDRKWLRFVIEQLLSNALKYTRTGSISVTLEEETVLCIRDTGIGIAPEDLPRVFEKGYTGYNGRADQKASGLGLYLCRRICMGLGHRIWITSRLGQGTAVYLDLSTQERSYE